MRRLVLGALLIVAGCGGDDGSGRAGNPFQEAIDLGAGRYLDMPVAATSSETTPGVVTYAFAPGSGPLCLTGQPYRFAIRDRGSEDLFIFLQGGGACWSDFCLAITVVPPGIPNADVLDPEKATNPVRSLSTVYLPYCDGSLFAGDTEYDDDADGRIDRYHRGLQNVSAALQIAKAQFPSPRRVILAGSSGGSFGTITTTVLVRTLWPGIDLLVFEDSGPGLARADDPGFISGLLDEFGVTQWLPRSCVDCLGNGHITRFIEWQLARDPRLRIAMFTGAEDSVIADIYLGIGGPSYRAAITAETGRLHERFPERYKRFIVDGTVHTTLLGNVTGIVGSDLSGIIIPTEVLPQLQSVRIGFIDTTVVGDVTAAAWFDAMLRGGPEWRDVLESEPVRR